MASIETYVYPTIYDLHTQKVGQFIGLMTVGKNPPLRVYESEAGLVCYDDNEDVIVRLDITPTDDMKHMVMVSNGGDTTRYHYTQCAPLATSHMGISQALQKFLGAPNRVFFMQSCRFKINTMDRALLMSGRSVATGTMADDKGNWLGNFPGRTWQRQLGEDFVKYMWKNFDLAWAHKVVCQRRGEYQYLPNVALFFDATDNLVLKLINRPNDKDTCEGFYVGSLLGKGFGYHIDGNAEKIPHIDTYMRHSLEDIIGQSLSEDDLKTDLFVTDVEYREEEGRWVLTSSIGDIAHMVKDTVPENTCAVRKHVSWTYDVFGQPIPSIPLLENLLINAFYRGYCRLARQNGV